jgi:hypothetical protein
MVDRYGQKFILYFNVHCCFSPLLTIRTFLNIYGRMQGRVVVVVVVFVIIFSDSNNNRTFILWFPLFHYCHLRSI